MFQLEVFFHSHKKLRFKRVCVKNEVNKENAPASGAR